MSAPYLSFIADETDQSQLAKFVRFSHASVEKRRDSISASQVKKTGPRRSLKEALRGPGLSLIAEHKRSSPTNAPFSTTTPLEERVADYERSGASAISILTEEKIWLGSVNDLTLARRVTDLPILAKDFIFDPFQIYEAKASGADAVLLMVSVLGEEYLKELYRLAYEIDLEALVEVHDKEELEIAIRVGAEIIGINNRDLRTLKIDLNRTLELESMVPSDRVLVSESGFEFSTDINKLKSTRVDGVLIGSALMRGHDIGVIVKDLLGKNALKDVGEVLGG